MIKMLSTNANVKPSEATAKGPTNVAPKEPANPVSAPPDPIVNSGLTVAMPPLMIQIPIVSEKTTVDSLHVIFPSF
jgi:hypothetical protein